jgi:succinate dehydrogenase / fumarate reductase membrane anchor subunit
MSDDLRSPLGRALGLGSAKEGVEHWWAQRVTAVALVPLVLWFVVALVGHLGANHAAALAWLRSPLTAVAMILLVVATFVHMALGVQVVIEDYVHHEGTKVASLVLIRLVCWVLGAAALFAVLRVAFGS